MCRQGGGVGLLVGEGTDAGRWRTYCPELNQVQDDNWKVRPDKNLTITEQNKIFVYTLKRDTGTLTEPFILLSSCAGILTPASETLKMKTEIYSN